MIAIKDVSPYEIAGSIPAFKLSRLLSQITQEVSVVNGKDKITLRYGRQTASLSKEIDGLKMYKELIFKDDIEYMKAPDDLIEGLSIIKYQNHRNKISGVYVDGSTAYVLNHNDVAYYTFDKAFRDTFWIPQDTTHMLLGLKEVWSEYAITQTFLYLRNETTEVAVKLKMQSQFPLKEVKQLLSPSVTAQITDEHKYIAFNEDINPALNRIKVSTAENVEQKALCNITVGDDIIVESVGTKDHIKEYLDGHASIECEVTVPIEAFQLLYNDSGGTVVVINDFMGTMFVCKTAKSAYLMKVSTK